MEQTYPQYIKFNQSIKKLIIKWDQDDPVRSKSRRTTLKIVGM